MVKTSNAHYNNTTTQNMNLEMDLWLAFGGNGGHAFTGIKKEVKPFGNYVSGKFIKTEDKEVITEAYIYYVPSDRYNKIFRVSFKDSEVFDSFETIQQAKRFITKCYGYGFKFYKHFKSFK